jgi:Na+/H+ antiporter family
MTKKIGLIFYLIIQTGTIKGIDQTIMDKIEHSDSYTSLLWGTMGAVLCSIVLYLLQWYKDGHEYCLPPLRHCYPLICQKDSNLDLYSDSHHSKMINNTIDTIENRQDLECDDIQSEVLARPLISFPVAIDSFLRGMVTFFPALVVLILAWAIGSVMIDIGADRLFTRWIVNGVKPELLPTSTFLLSFILALSTGSAWGTMSILYPLVLVPTYMAMLQYFMR